MDYDDTRKVALSLPPVDILVNNAGYNVPGFMRDIKADEFRKTFDCNVLCAVNMTQVVAEKMNENKIAGSIVMISSATQVVQNVDRQGLYGFSKASLAMANRNFAKELGPHNIRCNAVAPAVFPSDMSAAAISNPKSKMIANLIANTPLGRIGKAYEIANVALFLAHDGSSYVTGQSIVVCGGISA